MPSISKGICEGPSILPTPPAWGVSLWVPWDLLSINRARRRFLAATPPHPFIWVGGCGQFPVNLQGGVAVCVLPNSNPLRGPDVGGRAFQYLLYWMMCGLVLPNSNPLRGADVGLCTRLTHPPFFGGACRELSGFLTLLVGWYAIGGAADGLRYESFTPDGFVFPCLGPNAASIAPSISPS